MREIICPVCGRLFIRSPKHLYKDGKRCFCSWNCFVHRHETKKPRAVEQYTKNGTLIRTFRDVEEAATYMVGTVQEIDTACKNCSFYRNYLWRYKNDLS